VEISVGVEGRFTLIIILRAYTAQPTDRVNSIADSSNKIAFFYKVDQLITIHRTPFAFLADLKK
jgi:magnesium transporter